MWAFISLEFELLRFLEEKENWKNHHVIVLEGTFGDKKRVVLASSDEFNSLSFVQVIGKLGFIEWTPGVQTTLLVDKKKIQEFYWLHQHARRIPIRVWGGMSIWLTWMKAWSKKPKNRKYFSTSGVQWGCRSGGGLGVEGVLVQLGLRPVLLLLPNHPHHNRSQTWSWPTRFLSSSIPGYGNFAAETFGGRLFCLLFGMIGEKDLSKTKNKFWWNMFPPGIPLMLSVLADVGGLMAGGLEGAWWVLFSDTALAYLEERQQMERGTWLAVSHTSFIFNGLPDFGT